jgi:transposase
MLHAGLDLSRRRLDFCLLDEGGERVWEGAVAPDGDGLDGFARRVDGRLGPVQVRAAIESMTGARFVHDTLERCGWEVQVADAVKVKGLAPLACKTDRIDAWVLAELCRRDLVPAIWLPDFAQRQERERARWRLHLVKHRSMLKHRVHSALMTFGHACPVFRPLRRRRPSAAGTPGFPGPVARRRAGRGLPDRRPGPPDHRDRARAQAAGRRSLLRQLLQTVPGIAWVLGYTIAAEIGDITRFASPTKLAGYTGLCPKVRQSGEMDRRGPLAKTGPKYLRWALLEAATSACQHPVYRERYQATKTRLGRQRGAKIAQVDIARRLTEAIWHMLTRNQPFAPAGAAFPLAA